VLTFAEFLACAALFGFVGTFILLPPAVFLLQKLQTARIRRAARRIGKERLLQLADQRRDAPEGAPVPPEVQELQAAACAGARSIWWMTRLLNVGPWLIGAAVSWWVFYS
jgi:hypothetical protein